MNRRIVRVTVTLNADDRASIAKGHYGRTDGKVTRKECEDWVNGVIAGELDFITGTVDGAVEEDEP